VTSKVADVHNNHVVFILGAGYSAAAGMPVVANFMDAMRDSLDYAEANDPEGAKAIKRVFEFRLEAAKAGYRSSLDFENIEDLFSLAYSVDDAGLARALPRAIAATLHAAAKRSAITRTELQIQRLKNTEGRERARYHASANWHVVRGGPGRRDDKTAETLQTSDNQDIPIYDLANALILGLEHGREKGSSTFITFNYDSVLEQSLVRLGCAFTYSIPKSINRSSNVLNTESPIEILKLHGSTNWSLHRGRIAIHDSYLDAVSDGEQLLLQPPVWQKDRTGAYEAIWNRAVAALSRAAHIVLIGFSIPRTDLHFRYLMAAGLMSNISLRDISIIDPAAGHVRGILTEMLRAPDGSRLIVTPIAKSEAPFMGPPARWPFHQSDGIGSVREWLRKIGRLPVWAED
jgi:hypothetical protein